jgi:hypothetical protein
MTLHTDKDFEQQLFQNYIEFSQRSNNFSSPNLNHIQVNKNQIKKKKKVKILKEINIVD